MTINHNLPSYITTDELPPRWSALHEMRSNASAVSATICRRITKSADASYTSSPEECVDWIEQNLARCGELFTCKNKQRGFNNLAACHGYRVTARLPTGSTFNQVQRPTLTGWRWRDTRTL